MILKIVALLLICGFCGLTIRAQTPKIPEVNIQSWKRGGKQIVEQRFDIELTPQNREFSRDVYGKKGERYKLRVNFIPIRDEKFSETGKTTESWCVELRGVSNDRKRQEREGANLLREEGVGAPGDNFPRGDYIGYLYPKSTSRVMIDGEPWVDGVLYYPISAIRNIEVEGFVVSIRVIGFQMDQVDSHKVDLMQLRIELKNK